MKMIIGLITATIRMGPHRIAQIKPVIFSVPSPRDYLYNSPMQKIQADCFFYCWSGGISNINRVIFYLEGSC